MARTESVELPPATDRKPIASGAPGGTSTVRALATRPYVPHTTSAGVYMLGPEHAEAVARAAAGAEAAALLGVADAAAADAGMRTVEAATQQRLAGTAWMFAVVDRGEVKGFCALTGTAGPDPELRVWIIPSARRAGYGTLAARMMLDLAFRNLQFARVHAFAADGDPAGQRTLAKFGFGPGAHADLGDHRTWLGTPASTAFRLTRAEWIAHRDRPALAALHPDLRAILEAELAAGNEVAETGGGWPDPDSVFVRLRDPFRTRPASLPAGLVYTEPNDPHWWQADYSSRSPRHILAC